MSSGIKNRFSILFQKRQQAAPVPHETTRGSSVTIQNTLSECFISKLPREVLLRIFRSLQQERRSSRSITATRNRDLYHASLVCKTWNNLAAHISYHTIQFYSALSVLRFHKMLQVSPHICKIVKTLIFPTRYGQTCPKELLDAFEGIANQIESLSELNTTLRLVEEESPTGDGKEWFHILPIGEGRHDDLRRLCLYGNGDIPARFPTALPSFKRLHLLILKGVFISKPVSTDMTPALPHLRECIIEGGNTVLMMDNWLLSCPKLHLLSTIGPQPAAFSPSTDEFPMRLLVHGKLTCWSFSGSGHTRFGKWLASCNSITYLHLDWGLFSNNGADIFPPFLRQLGLDILPPDQVTLDAFDGHFRTISNIHNLYIFLCWGRNASFKHTEKGLKTLCAELSISLDIWDRSEYLVYEKRLPVLKLKKLGKRGLSKQLQSWEMAKT
ncbi:hypothetical protein FRC14_000798 [Serendipita sp. 396]|nr:hypothetical protein FRC14_000798 [Serendipita sp. 396]KAG8774588.1 hypothetical protein FRC15_001189 [Serendipita sp. 397]